MLVSVVHWIEINTIIMTSLVVREVMILNFQPDSIIDYFIKIIVDSAIRLSK